MWYRYMLVFKCYRYLAVCAFPLFSLLSKMVIAWGMRHEGFSGFSSACTATVPGSFELASHSSDPITGVTAHRPYYSPL